VFYRARQLQYDARPDRPDAVYARQLQEILGGQWGEMTMMTSYLLQGWNCRGPMKYRDLLLDSGTEEMAHVEMVSTMIARLLEGASAEVQGDAATEPGVEAVLSGERLDRILVDAAHTQHSIVSGGGATVSDSAGHPWTSRYAVTSGNLLADFRFNLTAESQERLQIARLYGMTADRGVRDMLSFLLARDTMHQNQWLAAIEELERDGLEQTPCPSRFPQVLEAEPYSYVYFNMSQGAETTEGRWTRGVSTDGRGEIEYIDQPLPLTEDEGLLRDVPRPRRIAETT
jgi:Mn-containing catalase